jgi:hypothetical protein
VDGVDEARAQLRERLAFLEDKIAPLQAEADEIRAMLAEGRSARTRAVLDGLADAVRRQPGLSGADYAAILRTPSPTVVRHLWALEKEGVVMRKGQRRGTRWFPAKA